MPLDNTCKYFGYEQHNGTVKPVLCESSREERNKVTYDSKSLNTGSIHRNIIA